MSPAVQKFLLELPEEKRMLAMRVRDIFISFNNGIGEAIKWNQLTFTFNKINIAFVYSFPNLDYVNLGFFYAMDLKDPGNLFEGTGKRMRHVKIFTTKDIKASQIKKWIGSTIELKSKNPMTKKSSRILNREIKTQD
jgi:hypothetical protein